MYLHIILLYFICLVGSPPKIIKEPLINELLFKVATHQNVNDEPFVLDCEAKGEPAPKYDVS